MDWRKCSSCKKPLPFSPPTGAPNKYWACNVSTCNRPRLFLAFCSVSCWDAHLASVRHRDTWAEEKDCPTAAFWEKVNAGTEVFPPRPVKEKVAEAPAPKPVSSGPKVVIRRKPSE